eukprot:4379877-Amphidinium_carterae.1
MEMLPSCDGFHAPACRCPAAAAAAAAAGQRNPTAVLLRAQLNSVMGTGDVSCLLQSVCKPLLARCVAQAAFPCSEKLYPTVLADLEGHSPLGLTGPS